MIKLLQLIFSKLISIHSRVYQERVPRKDENTNKAPLFPYIVFNLKNLDNSDSRDDNVLEIDIWDNKPLDTTELETLADSIEAYFKENKYHTNNFLQASFYKISRQPIPDPDENIRRRQLRYQVKVYFK